MSPAMRVVVDIVTFGLLFSLALVTYRLMRGPSIPDRAVASDLVAIHVVAIIGVHSLASKQPILIDLVIVTAIVGFMSVAVIGVYIERAARGKVQSEVGD
jgi:multicomponent Na+:H+ antiporter subunit F